MRRRVLTVLFLIAALAVVRVHLGDVAVYRAAGRAVYGGADLYDFRIAGRYGFTYPPFAAVLFATVAWLPLTAMFGVLVAGSLAAARTVVRCSRAPVALLAVQPVLATLAWGQVNLALCALVLYDLLVLRRGHLVGLAAALKLTPGLFVVHLLLCGRRREAAGAVAAFLAASALGALVLPGASWRYWTHDVIAGDGVGGFDHSGNQSIRGWAERLTTHAVPVWLALAVPVTVLGLRFARDAYRAGHEVLAAAVVGVTACLVSPISWTHHWVWCVPLIARVWRVRPACAVALAGVFAVPVLVPSACGYAFAVPLLLLSCTRRGRVLDLSWHSARLSASWWCGEARPERAVRRGRRAPGETCRQE